MTALVSSSTNSGTPSVRAMMVSMTSTGSTVPLLSRSTIASTPVRPRRLRVSRVTCGWPASVGWFSGRLVSSNRTGAVATAIERLLDQLQRGRVDPVRVLEHAAAPAAGAARPRIWSISASQRAGALGLRAQLDGAVAAGAVEAEQVGEQRRRRACRRPGRARPRACRAAVSAVSSVGEARGTARAAGSPARRRCRLWYGEHW